MSGARFEARRLGAGFAPPTLLLILSAWLLAWLMTRPGYWAVKLVVALAVAATVAWLWHRTRRVNRTLTRFLEALAHGDLAQSFRTAGRGSGLDELGRALDDALARLRAERHAAVADNRFADAMVDEVPTPLLIVGDDDRVRLANKAARRLFREADGLEAAAFARYGRTLADALSAIAPGGRQVVRVLWNGVAQRALVTASAFDRRGRPARIVSLSMIQGELERAELATQTDLVRVLTHEIMNSLTPITSLADSAARLLAEADADDREAMADARTAVETLARRAAGITGFVESYRDFCRTPSITVARFDASAWVADIARAFRATPRAKGVRFETSVRPDGLRVDGDAALLGQVVLNLLKNAGEAAAAGAGPPEVTLDVAVTDAGRVRIAVCDSGAGVPAALVDEVFLPFFTTKAGGTGVGLSLARQVVLLHGGTITAERAEAGGAAFVVIL